MSEFPYSKFLQALTDSAANLMQHGDSLEPFLLPPLGDGSPEKPPSGGFFFQRGESGDPEECAAA